MSSRAYVHDSVSQHWNFAALQIDTGFLDNRGIAFFNHAATRIGDRRRHIKRKKNEIIH